MTDSPFQKRVRFVVAVVAAGAVVVACVGSDPPVAEAPTDDGAEAGSSGSSGSSGMSGAPGSSGSSGSSGADDAGRSLDAKADAPVDAAADADAAPPPVACSEAIGTNAFYFRCSAAAATITPGGNFAVGTYLLTRWYAGSCVAFQIGWGELFQYNGETYLRYVRIETAEAGDAGTKYVGTALLKPGAAGAVSRTESCDAATKGMTTSGLYEQTAGSTGTLTLSFADHQERWTRQ